MTYRLAQVSRTQITKQRKSPYPEPPNEERKDSIEQGQLHPIFSEDYEEPKPLGMTKQSQYPSRRLFSHQFHGRREAGVLKTASATFGTTDQV